MIHANLGREFPLGEPRLDEVILKDRHAGIMHYVHSTVNPINARGAFDLYMHHAHDLGMRLAEIRKQKGLSQEQLGEMIGKNQSTIQRAEKMHKSAKMETYLACAAALGVGIEELFGEDRDQQEQFLLLKFRAAGDQGKRMLMSLANEVLEGQSETAPPEKTPGDL